MKSINKARPLFSLRSVPTPNLFWRFICPYQFVVIVRNKCVRRHVSVLRAGGQTTWDPNTYITTYTHMHAHARGRKYVHIYIHIAFKVLGQFCSRWVKRHFNTCVL